MEATDVLTALTALGCQVSPAGDTLHVRDPHHALRDPLRQAIRIHKAALLTLLTHSAPLSAGHKPGQVPESPQPVTQVTPCWVQTPGSCYACGTTRRWRSIYGAVVCARCHPPADVALVAAWAGEA
jgi:hypothetical protein